MSVTFGLCIVLGCNTWIVFIPCVSKPFHIYETGFDCGSDRSTVEFLIVIVVIRIDNKIQVICNSCSLCSCHCCGLSAGTSM
jgi:hypothetical protein